MHERTPCERKQWRPCKLLFSRANLSLSRKLELVSGECNISTTLSTTRPLINLRRTESRHLVLRSSFSEGHSARKAFGLSKAPMHNFQEFFCRPEGQRNHINHRNQNVSFQSFSPNGHNCSILKANLDG